MLQKPVLEKGMYVFLFKRVTLDEEDIGQEYSKQLAVLYIHHEKLMGGSPAQPSNLSSLVLRRGQPG